MIGKLIILNGSGHTEVTEDKMAKVKELWEGGYRFWANVGTDNAIELGESLKVGQISEDTNLVAMRLIAGG